jgi:methylmalonyl-CoA mutase
LYYETLKHTGEYPIVGVNTFFEQKRLTYCFAKEVIRSTTEEKEYQIKYPAGFARTQRRPKSATLMLKQLQQGSHSTTKTFLKN